MIAQLIGRIMRCQLGAEAVLTIRAHTIAPVAIVGNQAIDAALNGGAQHRLETGAPLRVIKTTMIFRPSADAVTGSGNELACRIDL